MARTLWTRWRAAFFSALFLFLSRPAQAIPRYSHTATMLPTGDVLLCGGSLSFTGAPTATCLLSDEQNSGLLSAAASMTTARSSHTATLLPNGKVLVAGGWNGAAALNTAQVYDPVLNSWAAEVTMTSARIHHSATLLKNGKVLICGGQTSAVSASLDSCELYDPTANNFTATVGSMQSLRARHTAVLLKTGRVWLAGGFNNGQSPPYIVTTEVYDPASDQFLATRSLITARADHTATMMGDGRILVAGGQNNRNVLENRGYIDTAEIYDPIADSVVPAARMPFRTSNHTASLMPSGRVAIYGGLGNVTTTYLTNFNRELEGGTITGAFDGILPYARITGGNLSITHDFELVSEAAGVVHDGDIFFSSPSISFVGGQIFMPPASSSQPTTGLRFELDGTGVGCRELAPNDIQCGHLQRAWTGGQIPNIQGFYWIEPAANSPQPFQLTVTTGTFDIFFAGGPLTEGNSPLPITSGKVYGQTRLPGLPRAFVGATISSGVVRVTAAGFIQLSSFTVSVTRGEMTIPAGVTISLAADGTSANSSIFTSTLTILEGEITWQGDDTSQTFSSPAKVPLADEFDAPAYPTVSPAGTLVFVPNQVSLIQADGLDILQSDVATVQVRAMSFADAAFYTPFDPDESANANTWAFRHGEYSDFGSTTAASFNHTSYVNAQGVLKVHGGRSCAGELRNLDCTVISTRSATIPVMEDGARAWQNTPAVLSSARGNHTSTLLPDGTILIAGGTNGPNILSSAQIMDVSGPQPALRQVGSMHTPRDIHSATLLPNGRVLVAGGFATTATSTGATATAEIYYPDTGVWLRTGSMNQARSNHASVLLPDGNVLVIGGYKDGVYLDDMEIYYSTAGVWRRYGPTAGALPQRRAQHTATLLPNGEVLVVGGLNGGGVLGSTLLINTSVYAVTAGAALPGGLNLHSHSATQLTDGRVLVAGGNDEFGEVVNAQVYDRASNSWTVVGDLAFGRLGHTGTLLPDGRVLVSGGFTSGGLPVALDETYAPSRDDFDTKLSLVEPRGYGTVTVDKDGNLWSVGGYDGAAYLNSIEKNRYVFEDFYSANGLRRPAISTMTAPLLDRGVNLSFTGSGFLGGTEASGGNGNSMGSVHSQPRLVLQRIEGNNGTGAQGSSGFNVDLSTYIYAGSNVWSNVDTAINVTLPAGEGSLPFGWYSARVGNNGVYSAGLLAQAGPPKPQNAVSGGVQANIVRVTRDTSTIEWRWTAPAGSYDGYAVYTGSTNVLLRTLTLTDPDGSCAPYPCFLQRDLIPNASASIKIAGYNRSGDGPLLQSVTWFTFASSVTLSTTAVGADFVNLSWLTNGNRLGTRYELEQSPDGFTSIITTPIARSYNFTSDEYLVTNLSPNTQYSFRVRAYNDNDIATIDSNIVTVTTRLTIADLGGVAQSSTTIRWSWNQPGGTALASQWRVYNSTTGALIAVVPPPTPPATTPSYLDEYLDVNKPRSIQVSAVDGSGLEGPLSPAATTYTLAKPPLPNPPGIDVIGHDIDRFTVKWNEPGNPPGTRYAVYVSSTLENFDIGVTSRTEAGVTSLAVDELFFPGEVWEVRVYALNDEPVANGGPFLSKDYLSVGLVPFQHPIPSSGVINVVPTRAQTPRDLVLTGATPSSLSVRWDNQQNTSSVTYQVNYSTDNFVLHNVVAVPYSAGFSGNAVTINGLASSTPYRIRVSARNLEGVEATIPPSPELSATTTSGGADPGALGGEVAAGENTAITGTIGLNPQRPVILNIPAGTFPSNVRVRLSTQSVAGNNLCAAPGVSTTTLAVSFTVTPELQPNRKIFLTVGYQDSDIGSLPTGRLSLLRHEPAFGKCVPAPAAADTTAKTITGELNHLSVYQVGAITPAAAVDGIRLFPNPWYSSRVAYVTLHQVPADAKVKIYTVRGELARELQPNGAGIATWDGLNRGGRHVASGVYLVSVESGGSRKVFKLVVLR